MTTDPVASHFQKCLTKKSRTDGNSLPGIAKGDCCIMLDLIRMKRDSFDMLIDRQNPGRFRGTSLLLDEMRRVLGDVACFHVLKWGASHTRGQLREDEGRGNKLHIIVLIDLLNNYKGTPAQLSAVHDECIRLHHAHFDSFSLAVCVQENDSIQEALAKLLSVQSLGRVQQGLVFAALRLKYGKQRRITTKKVFAADEQSSRDVIWRGDVQVWDGERLLAAVEVKDAVVNAIVWGRSAATHGKHKYDLYILASAFQPVTFQRDINAIKGTYALHLIDFFISLIFTASIETRTDSSVVIDELLAIYNDEFCKEIEKDRSIEIALVRTPMQSR